MLNNQNFYATFAHAVITLGVGLLISLSNFFHEHPLELFFYDRWVKSQLISEPEKRVLLVDIDEKSIAELGSWPWSRSTIAELVTTLLTHYDSAVVGIDIIFPNPAEHDEVLKKAFDHPKVILSQAYDTNPQSTVRVGRLVGNDMHVDQFFHAQKNAHGYIANTVTVLSDRSKVAHVTPHIDGDGQLRRMTPVFCFAQTCSTGLSFQMWQELNDYQTLSEWLPNYFFDKTHQNYWIPYRILPGGFQYVSAVDVIKKQASHEQISNLLVVIGSSALGLGDRVNTPIQNVAAGMEIHAQILSALLDNDWRQVYSTPFGIFGFFWMGAIAVAMVWRTSSVLTLLMGSFGLLFFTTITWIGLCQFYDGYVRVLPWLFAYMTFVVIWFFWAGSLWGMQVRHIAAQMAHFLPNFLVHKILKDEIVRAGSERASMSVLVADLRGFTQACEGRSPEDAATLAQTCLATLSDAVSCYGGVIEKYTGDGLMAIWGNLSDLEFDHASNAVAAGIAMQDAIDQLSPWFIANHFPEMTLSIGVNTGQMAVGYFGGQTRLAWSAQGDAVNLASRIEQLTRELGYSFLLGELTAHSINYKNCKDLGYHSVKGRLTAIKIYAFEKPSM